MLGLKAICQCSRREVPTKPVTYRTKQAPRKGAIQIACARCPVRAMSAEAAPVCSSSKDERAGEIRSPSKNLYHCNKIADIDATMKVILPQFLWKAAYSVCVVAALGASSAPAEQRFLLAADNQVIEVDRNGRVTDSIAKQGHSGIYDAWRLPDGGIAYAHRGGLAVFDAEKKPVLSHPARAGAKGTEANSCAVLEGGAQFALMDSGVCQIRVIDRTGKVLSETPLPELEEGGLHGRYRTIRAAGGGAAFWVAQYDRNTLLKVEEGSGKILQTIDLAPLLRSASRAHKAFGVTPLRDGALWVATSTGRELLQLGASGTVERSWNAQQLGLTCRYLLGTQQLENGRLLVACGDYHLKAIEEGRDLLAEIESEGKVVWRLTREQLADQIEGVVDSKTGLEEMRITNVHAYDSERIGEALNVVR